MLFCLPGVALQHAASPLRWSEMHYYKNVKVPDSQIIVARLYLTVLKSRNIEVQNVDQLCLLQK